MTRLGCLAAALLTGCLEFPAPPLCDDDETCAPEGYCDLVTGRCVPGERDGEGALDGAPDSEESDALHDVGDAEPGADLPIPDAGQEDAEPDTRGEDAAQDGAGEVDAREVDTGNVDAEVARPPSPWGDGRDGEVFVQGVRNLNTDRLSARRDEPDGVSFAVARVEDDAVVVDGAAVSGVAPGDRMLVIRLKGSGQAPPGRWTLARVADVDGQAIRFAEPLDVDFGAEPGVVAQRVPQYSRLVIAAGAVLTADAWDGHRGGIVAAMASDVVLVEQGGLVRADALGYRGGVPGERGEDGHGAESATGFVEEGGGDGGDGGYLHLPPDERREGAAGLGGGGGGGATTNDIAGGAAGAGGEPGGGAGVNGSPGMWGRHLGGGGAGRHVGGGYWPTAGGGGGAAPPNAASNDSRASGELLTLGGGGAHGGGGGAGGGIEVQFGGGGRANGDGGIPNRRDDGGGSAGQAGGGGGGLVWLAAPSLRLEGRMTAFGAAGGRGGRGGAGLADASNGGTNGGGGGGGRGGDGAAGGTIHLQTDELSGRALNLHVGGGPGGRFGGAGEGGNGGGDQYAGGRGGTGLWGRPGSGGVVALRVTDDADGDGLNPAQERLIGSEPETADTDGDGFSDGEEAAAGTSPQAGNPCLPVFEEPFEYADLDAMRVAGWGDARLRDDLEPLPDGWSIRNQALETTVNEDPPANPSYSAWFYRWLDTSAAGWAIDYRVRFDGPTQGGGLVFGGVHSAINPSQYDVRFQLEDFDVQAPGVPIGMNRVGVMHRRGVGTTRVEVFVSADLDGDWFEPADSRAMLEYPNDATSRNDLGIVGIYNRGVTMTVDDLRVCRLPTP